MRSRPKVQVFLSPPSVLPGQNLDVEAVLESRSSTPTEAISLTLTGREHDVAMRSRTVCELRATFEPVELEKGKRSFRARFPLPASIPPTHRGALFSASYELRVHVDIPWWPDVDRLFQVQVSQPPVEQAQAQVVFNSRGGDAKGEALYAEATLASPLVAPGGAIVGAVSFGNTAGTGKRRVEVAFVGVEQGGGQTREVHRFTATIHAGPLVEGEAIPLHVTLPPSAPPTTATHLGRLDWFLLVDAEGTWKREPMLRIPIEVRPLRAGVARMRVSAIGRARRSALWSAVAEEKQWTYDEGADRMERRFGHLRASLFVEQRATGGPHVVGEIDLADLGLDLDVRPKGWIHPFSGVEVGNDRFDRALAVAAREPEQARALLAGALADVLVLADEARLDDARATLAWEGAGIDPSAVRRAVTVVESAARLFADRIATLPAPKKLAASMDRWRALSARLGGRLRPGRPEIVGAELLGRPIALRVLWEGREGPIGLAIEARRAQSDEPERAPTKRAEAARAALERHGLVAIDRDRVTVTLRDESCDPATAEPLLEPTAELVALLDDLGERGPYR